MSRRDPVTVTAARERGRKRYEEHAAQWATSGELPGAALDLPLHPPSEVAASTDVDGAIRWAMEWREADDGGVVWVTRRWASLGTQEVPDRLLLRTPGALADFIGQSAHWDALSARVDAMVTYGGDAVRPVLRRHAKPLAELDDDDAARLLAAVSWLVENPDSGLYLRQLPVEGLSTKWVEKRRALVVGLVTAVTGRTDLGLRDAPRTVRIRVLDESLTAGGGLRDLAAPVDEVDALVMSPSHVIVVENLQTFLALPSLRRTVAIHGAGYAAGALGQISWVRDASVHYWGDLDRDGFAILDLVRGCCSRVDSLLMDEATLMNHRHMWAADPTRDRGLPLIHLTEAERRTYELLGTYGGVRLEQERLSWPLCIAALEERVGGEPSSSR